MHQQKSLSSMLSLFLVLFIDGMGLGLLFPILNTILIDPQAGFLSPNLSMGLRDFLYGLTIGVFMICWFFGAAILGDLSDSVGRKKSLMICLVGSFLGYFISAIAILTHSFTLLLIGRIIAGFTAGSQPIAQAAIVDVSSEEQKARNIGLILLSVSLGFVFGPIFGGLLSNERLVSWFSFETPMYFAAGLSLFNAIFLHLTFRETFVKAHDKIQVRWHHAVNIFISAFKQASIKKYSVVLLIMIFGWSNYFSFISLYLLQTYQYSALENSFFLAVMGIGFSIGCGYLVNVCTRHFSLDGTVISGLLVTASLVMMTLLGKQQWVAWVATLLIGMSLSVAYSVLLTIFSNQVNDDQQGWVMGVTGSIMALCFGLTSIFTGIIAHVGAVLPMLLAALGLGGSATLLFLFKRGDFQRSRKEMLQP
ncbi:MFS transporter [Legionella oakridgensis]|uniref:Arabinose efflux permease n=2 Tax=Legionella oakridgensis TaxID=29423 RepID=W0B7D0_9GAMM|nr:MFS transporter [Legionella oakridgensis]AHE66453.1 arabinose efflux permease [Legionella oakridgensis ATCC 33761 = DSM 21215]ETO93802.1 arabinose efflux permease [Legionella oakridgensis RV-2-2007]KTD43970.1 transporter of the major facilitator superfamily (MFS) [Legionella oakridgensis]STY19625.1 transporter of the major facilitator superfamily (MFS) [Legionella longbeachae]